MKVSLRLEDAILAAIDASAAEEGITRSRWIARLIEREINVTSASHPPAVSRGPRGKLHLRVDRRDVDAIDQVAGKLGVRRNQWIERVIKGKLWAGEGRLAPLPVTAAAMTEAVGQIVRIGRNVNQAVHAINSAPMPQSRLDLVRVGEHLVQMQADIRDTIDEARRTLLALAAGEREYWEDRH